MAHRPWQVVMMPETWIVWFGQRRIVRAFAMNGKGRALNFFAA